LIQLAAYTLGGLKTCTTACIIHVLARNDAVVCILLSLSKSGLDGSLGGESVGHCDACKRDRSLMNEAGFMMTVSKFEAR
jgi:hypothetical protein